MNVKYKDWAGRDIDESVASWVERELDNDRDGAIERVQAAQDEIQGLLGRLVEALGDAGVLSPDAIREVVKPGSYYAELYALVPQGDPDEE